MILNGFSLQFARRLRALANGAVLAFPLFLLTACSTVPEGLQGEFTQLTPQQTTARDIGRDVRWGGVILDAQPNQRQTCFEILSRELGSSARPKVKDLTQGRFLACTDGFQDPEVFAQGRELTLTGRIAGIEQRQVGEFEYRYPMVAANFVAMWPVRPDVMYHDFYGPGWGPYWGGGFWGLGSWGPYWGHGAWGGFHGGGAGRSRIYPGNASRERIEIQSTDAAAGANDAE